MKQVQLTFEDVGLFDEEALQTWSDELGNGYGGYDANAVFDLLLPKGYSLSFIKELMTGHYLCMTQTEEDFIRYFEGYKKTPIIEYEYLHCKTCKQQTGTVIVSYERVGKYYNEKGTLIKKEKFGKK